MESELIYLYCVTNEMPSVGAIIWAIHKLPIQLQYVHQNGLYAVICKVSAQEFSEDNLKKKLNDMEWLKTNVIMHEKIIERIMESTCVIPFKFGTLFNSEDNLKTMLEEYAETFKESLNNLKDKEEWGVKIYCDTDKLKNNINQNEEEILKIERELKVSSPGKAFLLKKKKETLITGLTDKKLNEYAMDSFEELKNQSISIYINKLLPVGTGEKKEEMILNSVFLIYTNKVLNFINTVENLKTKYKAKGISFDCTGPWPPYNFCVPVSSEK